ncbi:MAG: hypothetical protein KDA41_13495 [Planctomycetales bacterium]|nr:hypothetical protein [Planctomycetales bacterium]
MHKDTPSLSTFTLAPHGAMGRIAVEVEAFLAFDERMDDELAQLVDRFAKFQTPGSLSRRRNFRTSTKLPPAP